MEQLWLALFHGILIGAKFRQALFDESVKDFDGINPRHGHVKGKQLPRMAGKTGFDQRQYLNGDLVRCKRGKRLGRYCCQLLVGLAQQQA